MTHAGGAKAEIEEKRLFLELSLAAGLPLVYSFISLSFASFPLKIQPPTASKSTGTQLIMCHSAQA